MGEDFFNMDNILSGDEVASLFSDTESPQQEEQDTQPEKQAEKKTEAEDKDTNIAEVKNSEELFGDWPESVGNGETQGGEGTTDTAGSNSPDKPNFYSSITDALVDDGVFPDLTEERIKQVVTPEDFRNLIEERIQAELNEKQKRIDAALSAGVNTDVIRQYENTMSYLNGITPELISEEGERGDDIRRRVLLQDFLNKNFSQENAVKMIKVLMDSGEDIEQAKLALAENKKFFAAKYQQILDNAQAAELEEKQERARQVEQLKKDIMSGDKVFGDIEIDKSTRQKILDNISKPIHKDPKTGELYTALQKYKMENENDFIRNVGLLFTLTDGFTDLSKLINPTAKKEVRKKMKELESKLSGSSRDTGGPLKYVGTSQADAAGKTFFDMGYTIDI